MHWFGAVARSLGSRVAPGSESHFAKGTFNSLENLEVVNGKLGKLMHQCSNLGGI